VGALRGTPLHSRTAPLCQAQNWRRWAGFIVASSYELTHEPEYFAIRTTAALIDVSPLFKYRVEGPDAGRLLDRVMTRDISRCAVGQVMYTPWCDEGGKVLDDGTLARLGETLFRVTSADPNLRWFEENAYGLDVRIEDISETTSALALQGPASRAILQRVAEADLAPLRYYRLVRTRVAGVPAEISRTGYTGDLGYEVWVGADDALRVWDALVEAGGPYGLLPVGMLALDVARVEAGLLLIEVDYVSSRKALVESQKSSPYELGLGWTVAREKPADFVGKAALAAEAARGPAWRFVGLEIDWPALEAEYARVGLPPQLPTIAWRASVPLLSGGRQVGYATSGCWSPILKNYIALAHLPAHLAQTGTELALEVIVEHWRRRVPARVARLPFFDPPRKRQ
jgi:aminomethyltransferase